MKFLVELLIVAAMWAVGIAVAVAGIFCLAAEDLAENCEPHCNFVVWEIIGWVLLIVAGALFVGGPLLARRVAR